MKGIGIFVSVLLVASRVAMYTRPPDRELDPQDSAWVTAFRAWNTDLGRSLDRAEVSIGVSRGERLEPEVVPRLEACRASLGEVDIPPTLLQRALDEGTFACGEIEVASRCTRTTALQLWPRPSYT